MQYKEFTTSAGYTLRYRVLPLDLRAMIIASVRAEWAKGDDASKHPPKPPTVRVETGPDEWEDKVHDKDPAYLNDLAAYDRRIEASPDVTKKMVAAITAATQCEIDSEALQVHRELLSLVGVDLPADTTDKELFLWHIALPDTDEQLKYQGLVFGSQWAALVEAQRRAFRSALGRAADRVSENAIGELGV